MSRYDDMPAAVLISKRSDYQPSHVLHLLLSLITFGIWLPVWLLVAISHSNERSKIDAALRRKESAGA
jgi:hypothetical protein